MEEFVFGLEVHWVLPFLLFSSAFNFLLILLTLLKIRWIMKEFSNIRLEVAQSKAEGNRLDRVTNSEQSLKQPPSDRDTPCTPMKSYTASKSETQSA